VKGEIASAALAAFDALWSRGDFTCTIEAGGSDYRIRCDDRSVPAAADHHPAVARPRWDEAGLAPDACVPMTLLSKGKRGYFNVAGYANPWAKGILAAVSASVRTIDLTSPNFNAPPLQGALVEAVAKRDVRVRLLLPDERNENQVNGLGGFGSNAQAVRVLRACAIVARARSEQEYRRLTRNVQAGWWVAEGARSRFLGDGPGCDHTKFASFDGQALVVGSANLDDQSFYHSTETSILVDDAVVTRAVSGFVFEPEWRRSERFSLATRPPGGPFMPPDSWPDLPGSDARSLCSGLGYSLR
jgi:phosphatidylserine/phosphatidylglycerophosphate/cardiolipin synthase-like enzyme